MKIKALGMQLVCRSGIFHSLIPSFADYIVLYSTINSLVSKYFVEMCEINELKNNKIEHILCRNELMVNSEIKFLKYFKRI